MEERKTHFKRPTTTRPPSLFNLTLLAVLFGAAAGFGGYLMAKTFKPMTDVNYLDLINNQRDIKINIEQPLTNVADKYQNSVAGVYRPVKTIATVGQPLFNEDQFLGSAVVVTSDGWLMTTDQVITDQQGVVALNDDLYIIEDIKIDEFTGAVFIKVDGQSLQPVDFQLTDSLKAGERLFTNIDLPHSFYHTFYATFLSNIHYSVGQYLSSDRIDYYLQVSDDLSNDNFLAAPYFNMEGDLLGLAYKVNDSEVLLPAEYLKQAVKHLLNNTERPSLGIWYVDKENNSGFTELGNFIFHPTLRAVSFNSPAYQAGLQAGDQIVAVNNTAISNNKTLTSIIQNYRPGDIVIIKVSREGVEQDLEVKL